MPLKSIKISCQLINYVAEVTVEQEYQNVEEGPIECEYFNALLQILYILLEKVEV